MPSHSQNIFPPEWNLADHWNVVMKTQAPAPADVRPRYVERTFALQVASVPGAQSANYRIEARAADSPDEPIYELSYRADFTLERVTRRDGAGAEQTLLSNGNQPFIYYERRLPVIPDFPMSGPAGAAGRREFTIGGNRAVQEMQVTGKQARIELQRIEAMGSLRVVMEWTAGEPWWSTIQCTENPPAGAPVPGHVVASGYLLKGSIVHKE
ncbi:MAG: hypothetical protein ACRD9L_08115 [Bryobacteraceae bacterium]